MAPQFLARLIVPPFLLISIATCAIYLSNDELKDLIYPQQRLMLPHDRSVPVTRVIGAALAVRLGAVPRIDA